MIGKGKGAKGIPWTPERERRLAAMWADGASATQIARDLGGITRNAAIGKLHRLSLRRGPKAATTAARFPRSRPSAPLTPRAPVKRKRTKKPIAAKPAVAIPPPPPPPKPKRPPSPPIGKFTILDLHDAVCSFPLADYHARPPYLFCGAPRFAGAYCEDHARRCYPALARGP